MRIVGKANGKLRRMLEQIMKERRSYQNELAFRAGDALPFNVKDPNKDQNIVKGAVRVVLDDMCQIQSRRGTIIYPHQLSEREVNILRRQLFRHGLGKRVEAIVPVRLEEGMGTEILIAKKKRG